VTVSFDEQWNADDDPYAVILSPAAPAEAYERRQPTIDDLLDLRLRLAHDIEYGAFPEYHPGLELAVNYVDTLLESL
jgi:hypothetical protein